MGDAAQIDLLARLGLIAFAWVVISCAFVGYWAILRKQDKTRAAECKELAKRADEDAMSVHVQLLSGNITPAMRDELVRTHHQKLEDRDYWLRRANAWQTGDI